MYTVACVAIAALTEPWGVLLASGFASELLKVTFLMLFVAGTDYVSCLPVKEATLGKKALHIAGGELAR